MRDKFNILYKGIKQVFKNKRYLLAVLVSALFIYLVALLTNKIEFVLYVLQSDLFNFTVRVKLIFSTLFSIQTNFSSLKSFILLIILAIISGINFTMLVYLLRRQAKATKEAGASFFGIIAGMFGIGCAACGSVVLTSIFGLAFTGSIISFLPLGGLEFMIIAIIIMVISIYYISKKIVNPMVCKPKRPSEIAK